MEGKRRDGCDKEKPKVSVNVIPGGKAVVKKNKKKKFKKKKQSVRAMVSKEIVAVEKKERSPEAALDKEAIQMARSIVKKYAVSALVPATTASDVPSDGFNSMVAALLDDWCRKTPICIKSFPTSTDNIYPMDLYLLCWVAFIMRLRDVGVVNGLSDLSFGGREMQIPIALAEVLKYYSPYKRGNVTVISQFTAPSSVSSATIVSVGQYDESNLASLIFGGIAGSLIYDHLAPFTNCDLAAFRNWAPITLANWCSDRLPRVIAAMKQARIPMVAMSQIPRFAPDASAYCWYGVDAITSALEPGRVYFNCLDFDAEIAAVLCNGRSRRNFLAAKYKVYSQPNSTCSRYYGNISAQNAFAKGLVFFMRFQRSFRAGKTKSQYSIRGNKVKTFMVVSKYFDGTFFVNLILNTWSSTFSQIPGFDDAIGARQFIGLTSLMIIVGHMMQRRLEEHSPFPQYALKVGSNFCPMAYWTSTMEDSTRIPIALCKFINSVGLVVDDGRMVVPKTFDVPNTDVYNWPPPGPVVNVFKGSQATLSAYGPYAATGAGPQQIFPYMVEGSLGLAAAPTLDGSLFRIDTAFLTAMQAAITVTNPYPSMMLNGNIAAIIKSLNGQASKIVGMSIFNKWDVCRPELLGDAFQMLVQGVWGSSARQNFNSVPFGLDMVGSPLPNGEISFLRYELAQFYSNVQLTECELASAMLLGCSGANGTAFLSPSDFNAAFSIVLPQTSATSSMINTVLQQIATVDPGDNNGSQAITLHKQTKAGDIATTKPVERLGSAAWDKAIDLSVGVTKQLSGKAAGAACSMIPMVGPFVAPLCDVSVNMLVDFFGSRSCVTDAKMVANGTSENAKVIADSIYEGAKQLGAGAKVYVEESAQALKVSTMKMLQNPNVYAAVEQFHK